MAQEGAKRHRFVYRIIVPTYLYCDERDFGDLIDAMIWFQDDYTIQAFKTTLFRLYSFDFCDEDDLSNCFWIVYVKTHAQNQAKCGISSSFFQKPAQQPLPRHLAQF